MERHHKDEEQSNIDETEFYVDHKIEMSDSAKDAMIGRLKVELQEKDATIDGLKVELEEKEAIIDGLKKKVQELQQLKVLRAHIGIWALNEWIKSSPMGQSLFPEPNHNIELLLNLSPDEKSQVICPFIKTIRKPDNSEYSPDTIFYLILAIQKYLIQNGKHLNILIDSSCKGISDTLDEVLTKSLDEYLKSGEA